MFITVAQFLLSLSILVVLHELGHFSTAKWFKARVEKFYLFFNPKFSLYKKQIGETEYGIGWLPLGGYVKISGMIDESFDTEQMQSEPKPYEFRSKPAWQRLIIMVAGVFVNFVLGVFLFSVVLYTWGKDYIVNDSLPEGIAVSEVGAELGLQDGDKILKIDDVIFDRFSSGAFSKELVINQAKNIYIERNGRPITLPVKKEVVTKLTKYENRNVKAVAVRHPYIFGEVTKDSNADKAGLQVGDKVIAVNGEATPYAHQFLKSMSAFVPVKKKLLQRLFGKKKPEEKIPDSITITVDRGGSAVTKTVKLEKGRMGVRPQPLNNFVSIENESYGPGSALTAGWERSITFITDQIKAFGHMFAGKIKAKDSLGSFITIGSMFGDTWDWQRFWSMTASLSLLLGFINLLPIPALDGGYVMFLLFESITGIKVPDRIMEIATIAGFLILVVLMIYSFGLDLSRVI